jgi:hypothetical protein
MNKTVLFLEKFTCILLLSLTILLSSCAPPKDRLKNNLGYKELTKLLAKEQKELLQTRENEIKNLQKKLTLKKLSNQSCLNLTH